MTDATSASGSTTGAGDAGASNAQAAAGAKDETAAQGPVGGRRSKSGRGPYPYVRGYQSEGGGFAPTNTHRGRMRSWVAVAVFLAGFLLAGLGLPLGLNWWLLGIGGGLMAVGSVLFLVTDIFADVVLDDPRRESEEPHNTPLHRIKSQDRRRAEDEEGHRPATEDRQGPGSRAAG